MDTGLIAPESLVVGRRWETGGVAILGKRGTVGADARRHNTMRSKQRSSGRYMRSINGSVRWDKEISATASLYQNRHGWLIRDAMKASVRLRQLLRSREVGEKLGLHIAVIDNRTNANAFKLSLDFLLLRLVPDDDDVGGLWFGSGTTNDRLSEGWTRAQ
ncbi:hypothetical protein L210DRAFT_3634217 [Boletus edulis BED1]|uniref:Uncharacterized protein n=1 Tax=Boletus edulis BED1 TaxID=1328754 RepID=A0AAD4G8P3_BOLED|nr:hypothetical protein L210DRAFT_3634217 [Boletus edulis BED1]